jgi:undecaprenyl-diphosphatase
MVHAGIVQRQWPISQPSVHGTILEMFTAIARLDTAALIHIVSLRTYGSLLVGTWVTELASVTTVAGILLVSAFVLGRTRRWHDLSGLFIAVVGSSFAVNVLKVLIHRARPDMAYAAYAEAGYSMPSAHAAAAISLYGFIAWLIWRDCERKWWHGGAMILSCVLILAIGFTRVFLGVHYPSDVIAGYVVGGIFLTIGMLTTRKWRNRNLC